MDARASRLPKGKIFFPVHRTKTVRGLSHMSTGPRQSPIGIHIACPLCMNFLALLVAFFDRCRALMERRSTRQAPPQVSLASHIARRFARRLAEDSRCNIDGIYLFLRVPDTGTGDAISQRCLPATLPFRRFLERKHYYVC